MFTSPKTSISNLKLERYCEDPAVKFDVAGALSYSASDSLYPARRTEISVHSSSHFDSPANGQLEGPHRGLAPLDTFVHDFVRDIYKPGFADWDTLIDLGAGDALPKVFSTEFDFKCYTSGSSVLNIRSKSGTRCLSRARRWNSGGRLVL